jgi:predicted TIM-barrel fold metal-dependent hydrolase
MMEALQHLVPDPGARHRILWENTHKLWVSTR